MTLAYPLGLVGLVLIPVLILIYIIKNKYTEKTVSSTYLWTLSERFIKRRIPINRIVGLISLILQILAVIIISFCLTQPSLIIPAAANDYCFILDGTGSMSTRTGESTRFDEGKKKIAEIIDGSMKGSSFSLVYIGGDTERIYEKYTDKQRALSLLDDLKVSSDAAGFEDALGIAQGYFNDNPSLLTYLVTDKSFEGTENIELLDVSSQNDNYAVSGLSYVLKDGALNISGNVVSYESDKTLTVNLYLDGEQTPFDSMQVSVTALEAAPFTFVCEGRTECKSARAVISESDNLPEDNEAIIFNIDYENSSRTLLVSDSPFYIQASLTSTGNSQIDVVGTEKYEETTGYDLYIFDGFMPAEMPRDGAVWFFNPTKSLTGANFNYQGSNYPSNPATYSKSTSKNVNSLLDGLTRREFELSKYVKCGLSDKFTTLISCDDNPLVFVGANVYGNREVVFAFDLHDTAPFTLSLDCSVLMANLIKYSFPSVLDETAYYCGDTLPINVVAGTKTIKVTSPSGRNTFPQTNVAICEYRLSEVGTYTVELTMKDDSVRTFNVFSALPEEERIPEVKETSFIIRGTAENNKTNGIYDDLIALFIVLAVIAVADFGVYCYEQYQLR